MNPSPFRFQPTIRRWLGRLVVMLVVVLVGTTFAWSGRAAGAMSLPPGFEDVIVTQVARPTALAFTPDGRMLIAQQRGWVRVFANDTLAPDAVLDYTARICEGFERGLLGIAVDPDFATNNHIYLYYTFKKTAVCGRNDADIPVNRVSRFVLPASGPIDVSTETVLLDNIPSPNGNHNSGDLQFGNDGYLYVTVGDGGCHYQRPTDCAAFNDVAEETNVLLGKVLRITRDGGIPPANPFMGADSARCQHTGRTTARFCQEVFAFGLRNPFKMAFDGNASTARFYINDVGQDTWEEINEGAPGADYGWNRREGACVAGTTANCGAPPAGVTNPVYAYQHANGCSSITGGAFVPTGLWPAAYDGAYLFGDYACGKIFMLAPGGTTTSDFVTDVGGSSITSLRFGPHGSTQALYYTSFQPLGRGSSIHRVTYTAAANRAPTAAIQANPTAGSVPLTVAFDGSRSSDPDGDALRYHWDFGDGSAGATTATTSHTYRASGHFTATLTITDTGGLSASATTPVEVGNNAPVASITLPAPDMRYAVGQTITLQGQATDPEDGRLPKTQLSWTVTLHHDTHTHPYLPPTVGNKLTFTTPPPEDLAAARTSWLEIQLTATDKEGVSTTVTRQLLPKTVDVTFTTVPAGLDMMVNGVRMRTPQVVRSWEGYVLRANQVAQVDAADRWVLHDRWENGSTTAPRTIVTPAAPITYTEQYRAATTPGVQGTFYDRQDFTGATRSLWSERIDYDWKTGTPIDGIAEDTFSVRWNGRIEPLYTETYTFTLASDEGARLWIDDQLVIDHWTPHTLAERSGTIALVGGRKYAIRVDYFDRSGKAAAQLFWASPRQPREIVPRERLFPAVSGLVARYYADASFASPAMTRIDPAPNVNWAAGSPFVGTTGRPFGVRWTGVVRPDFRETYTLYALSEGKVRVWLGDTLVIDNWTEHALVENRATVDLSGATSYPMRVEYQDSADRARVTLSWASASQPKTAITSRSFVPFGPTP